MTNEEITRWLEEHIQLFPPTNKAPDAEEQKKIFEIANILDKTQTHRPTSCGRCYGNAKRAIMRNMQIF